MKKILIVLFVAVLGFTSFAQDNEFHKMMRELYQAEFVDVMNENMNLTEVENAVFQPIFNDFLAELGEVMDNKLKTQAKFSKYFDGMTDDQVKTVVTEIFANNKSYDKMLGKYTKKIGKVISPQTAFRFLLIVEKVKSTIDYSTIQNVPLVKN